MINESMPNGIVDEGDYFFVECCSSGCYGNDMEIEVDNYDELLAKLFELGWKIDDEGCPICDWCIARNNGDIEGIW